MSLKSSSNKLEKQYPIGIIGGGQLALMIVEAAKKRGIKVCVQTNSVNDPGASKADKVIEADPLQVRGNKNLIKECRKIIFENEWVKIDKLKQIGSNEFFIPSLDSLAPLVDRISQKKFIDKLNLPTSKWITVNDFKELKEDEINNWKFPIMAKSLKGGYDGKGNKKIANKKDFESFLEESKSQDWLLEEWVDYSKEIALVGSRDINGNVRIFPIVETFQSNKVCHWVLSPAKTNYEINLFALNIFSSIVNELNYVGILSIEFFLGDCGLLINEIAPRTHNSGHFSIEACNSSQFDQQVCISSGIEPPEIRMICDGSIMINLLGLKKFFPIKIEERIERLSNIKGSNLHWYGKLKENLGRKMGHVTFLLEETNYEDRLKKATQILREVSLIWPSPYD